MTIWILPQTLTPEEEANIDGREYVVLPLGNAPDVSRAIDAGAYRRLLQTLDPDAPPETITRTFERHWRFLSELHPEDIVAVPLLSRREIALAEVTGHYVYKDGGHTMPVKWHEKRIAFRAVKKFGGLFEAASAQALTEVKHVEARNLIRDRLPHTKSRFSAIKWLIFIIIGIRGAMYILQLIKSSGAALP